jgi:tRNA modification GTPase
LDQFHGTLRHAIEEIRQAIAIGKLGDAREKIDALLAFAPLGRHLVAPWQVVIAGRPNVGKSSLINALVGYDRSIVHPAPGATRDVVAASTAIDGWPATLCDTAGLHGGGDAVERAGIALAERRIAEADLVLLVFDASVSWSAPDAALLATLPRAVVVHNKIDAAVASDPHRPEGLRTSALCGEGLEALLRETAARLVPHPPPSAAAVPFAEEHVAELTRLRQSLCIDP